MLNWEHVYFRVFVPGWACTKYSNIIIFNNLKNYIKFSIIFSDVNECKSNPCQHTCINVPGSFNCKCYTCYTKLGTKCELRQCKIGGKCFTYGDVNPSNHCEVKQHIRSVLSAMNWTHIRATFNSEKRYKNIEKNIAFCNWKIDICPNCHDNVCFNCILKRVQRRICNL